MTLDLNKIPATKPATVEDLFKQWGWTTTEGRSAEFRDFDESQHPRGPDGKFTDSGGSADDTTGLPKGWHWKTGAQNTVVKDGEPYTTIHDIHGNPVDPKIVATLDDLQSKYPVDIASLKVQIAYDMDDSEGGVTENIPAYPHGDYSIDLNAHLFEDSARGEKLRAMWDTNTTEHQALMPSAAGDIGQYCITHEYGHVVDFTGGAQISANGNVVSNAQLNLMDKVDALTPSGEARLVDSMSTYAQSSPAEAMAEGFAEHVMTDGKTTSAFSKTVWKAYLDAGVVKK